MKKCCKCKSDIQDDKTWCKNCYTKLKAKWDKEILDWKLKNER